MLGEKYTLDIRPTFIDELDRAATYIEQNLGNPVAADKLVNDTYEAIDRALAHPLVTAPRYRLFDGLSWGIAHVGWLCRNRSWIRHEGWLVRG